MTRSLRIVTGNANGLPQHMNEMFSLNNNVDIMLISKTHLTKEHYYKILSYSIYHTTHLHDTAHGNTGIIIKNNIRHHELDNFKSNFLQAIIVKIEDWCGSLLFHLYIALQNI